MEKYLLALDLDGTTVDDTGDLHEDTRLALRCAKEAGHTVCFVTGRRDIDMVAIQDRCESIDYFVLNNGGKLVRCADGAVLFNEMVEPDDAATLIRYCLASNYQLYVMSGMYWGTNKFNDGLLHYAKRVGRQPELYRCLEETPYTHVEGFIATADIKPITAFIEKNGMPLDYLSSEPDCADIIRAGISKWGGLARLMELLDVPPEQVVAAGDYYNDLDMIRNAGIGVAVSSALPCVQEAADYVTRHDNNHNAVGDIVYDLLLGSKTGLCLPVHTGGEYTCEGLKSK